MRSSRNDTHFLSNFRPYQVRFIVIILSEMIIIPAAAILSTNMLVLATSMLSIIIPLSKYFIVSRRGASRCRYAEEPAPTVGLRLISYAD